jgi:hypothetical protein
LSGVFVRFRAPLSFWEQQKQQTFLGETAKRRLILGEAADHKIDQKIL